MPLKRLTEQTISNLLQECKLEETQIIAVVDTLASPVADHLLEIFRDPVANRSLHIETTRAHGDYAKLINHGADIASANVLSWIYPGDLFSTERFEHIHTALEKADLWFATQASPSHQTENTTNSQESFTHDLSQLDRLLWLPNLSKRNIVHPRSIVIRRQLFESIGKLTTGYTGFPIPKKIIPGSAEYELVLRSLASLEKQHQLRRSNTTTEPKLILRESSMMKVQPREFELISRKFEHLKTWVSLARSAQNLPHRLVTKPAREWLESQRQKFLKPGKN